MMTVDKLNKLEAKYKDFLPRNAKYETLVSQSINIDDEECEEQENNMGYAATQNTLIEKQQRHFNIRLNDAFWPKEDQLRKKHTYKKMVEIEDTNWDAFEKDMEFLKTHRRKVEDVIMIGDPVKMFEAVDAFEKMTVQ